MGGSSNEKHQMQDIKMYIMQILKESKDKENPSEENLSVILSNIDQMDHHDFVRTDQIITRMWNKDENEYQWGSAVLNCKWKKL